jgi:hypothetical protein
MLRVVTINKTSLNRTRGVPWQQFALIDDNVLTAVATCINIPLNVRHLNLSKWDNLSAFRRHCQRLNMFSI